MGNKFVDTNNAVSNSVAELMQDKLNGGTLYNWGEVLWISDGSQVAIATCMYLCCCVARAVFFSHASQHWCICITWSCSHMCVCTRLATLVQTLATTTFSGHGHSETNVTPLPSSLCKIWMLKT